jgi:histidyl-tRNA synthetase
MVYEHEIPSGSKLYFGKSAKIKREVENICSGYLESQNFSEIVTPIFSYHQQESFIDTKVLVRLNDSTNHEVSLRADSTVDVVRIVTKRLSRSEDTKRWFYIQPVFAFPTHEQYQVGAEVIDGTLEEVANLSLNILDRLNLEFNFQIANIAIANLLIKEYGFREDDIKNIKLEKILNSNYSWIESLVEVNTLEDLEDLSIYPQDLKEELIKIKDVANKIKAKNILISPLYYAQMRYYKSLVFRAFKGTKLYSTGGVYSIKGINGAGFAIYTDDIISNKMQRD